MTERIFKAKRPALDNDVPRKMIAAHALLERAEADLQRLSELLDAPELDRGRMRRSPNDGQQYVRYALEELRELER